MVASDRHELAAVVRAGTGDLVRRENTRSGESQRYTLFQCIASASLCKAM